MKTPSTKSPYRLKRAVAYLTDGNGVLTIKLLAPWDGKGRLDTYPAAIRLAVRAQAFLFATVEESHKIWTARQMGRDVEAAVWDDLLCDRANDMMQASRQRLAQVRRDDAITYSRANQPSWLNKLQDKIEGPAQDSDDHEPERNEP